MILGIWDSQQRNKGSSSYTVGPLSILLLPQQSNRRRGQCNLSGPTRSSAGTDPQTTTTQYKKVAYFMRGISRGHMFHCNGGHLERQTVIALVHFASQDGCHCHGKSKQRLVSPTSFLISSHTSLKSSALTLMSLRTCPQLTSELSTSSL